jgi:hypothetical protein
VPTLEELGMKPATSPHRGGETKALRVLDDYLKNEEAVVTFEKPKTECVRPSHALTRPTRIQPVRL